MILNSTLGASVAASLSASHATCHLLQRTTLQSCSQKTQLFGKPMKLPVQRAVLVSLDDAAARESPQGAAHANTDHLSATRWARSLRQT